jgi:hypothetical protein
MKTRNEKDAHAALADTARMRRVDLLRGDPLEDTQRLPVCAHGNIDFMCKLCAREQARVHEWGE